MNRPDIDLVFGRGRLRMATGKHVEVYREEAPPGERRHYSKRFLATEAGDFRQWTEREAQILTRLAGLGIAPMPRLEPFDHGAYGRLELLRTYDAGVTVDHWATLLPVQREGTQLRHVFEDCAHWWALARHCLISLDTLHRQGMVHLDVKADNICIPVGPEGFDRTDPGAVMRPCFEDLALIDFAFSLVSGEELDEALPIAGHTEYDYQSPRLFNALEAGRKGDLAPTAQLDWRCDLFSLAAMLRRYLPAAEGPAATSWTPWRLEQARTLVRRLREAHDADLPAQSPHQALLALTKQALADAELSASLKRGWMLAAESAVSPSELATPLTRMAMPATASLPRSESEWVARPPSAVPVPAPARRNAWVQGWVTVAAIAVPLLGTWWWAMQPRPATERGADAALTRPAEAVRTTPLTPATPVAEQQALPSAPPPVAVAQPAPQPAASAAPPARPAAQPEAPAASAAVVTAARDEAPSRLAPAPTRAPVAAAPTRAAARSRVVTRPPVSPPPATDRPWVDQAERERALEWLTRRGPAPQPGMTLPPPPQTARASAAKPSGPDLNR
jgi:serine/threonine protein kinase